MTITKKALRQAVNMTNTLHDEQGLYTMKQTNIKYLDNILLKNQELQVLSIHNLRQIPTNDLQQFCLARGIYCLPTLELIEFLKEEIGVQRLGKIAIEIGAGNGAIARSLGIIATDSFMHNDPNVKVHYLRGKQPVTQYGKDVHKLDAEQAINKFNPSCVIGAFITHKFKEEFRADGGNMYGVEEELIVQRGIKYIFVGNEETHKQKYIKKIYPEFRQYKFDFLFHKVVDQRHNVIWIWN
jgi:hypothetical protein